MENPTVSELISQAQNIVDFLKNILEYDTARCEGIRISLSGEVNFTLSYRDKFQENLPVEMHYRHDTYVSWNRETINDKLHSWPSREQRELEILSRKMATLGQDLNEIHSAQVRAFVKRLEPDMEKLRAMLTHQEE